jgi:hypothetical protein
MALFAGVAALADDGARRVGEIKFTNGLHPMVQFGGISRIESRERNDGK